ncbi:MAG: alkaline phosphatase family protein [Candidatus Pacearchaeota archaeon]
MKGVLILIDGLGDLPCKELGGKTPLEAAKKPNLNYFAKHGKQGYMYTIKEKITPGSDEAVISILGNKIETSYRGWLEAIGSGINLKRGDVAFRANFATIDDFENRNILDRRVGRSLTTREATILTKDINKAMSKKFIFKNTIQHRGVLVLRGGFSDNVSGTDLPLYTEKGKTGKFRFSEPLDETENSRFTAEMVNDFIYKSYKVLEKHPINLERIKKGLLPANIILLRSPSNEPPNLIKYKKWGAILYMPVEIGISKISGMKIFSITYPDLKNYDVYKNLNDGLKQACKFTLKTIKEQKDKFDYFYVHFKETDVPGHDNKPKEKKKMIEQLDRLFFKEFRKIIEKDKIKTIITADHSTPCNLKDHSSHPVPVLYCDWQKSEDKNFCERTARGGKLGKIYGIELLEKLGFKKK